MRSLTRYNSNWKKSNRRKIRHYYYHIIYITTIAYGMYNGAIFGYSYSCGHIGMLSQPIM
jgi:hypothetical protein